jgi:hypothetical protein
VSTVARAERRRGARARADGAAEDRSDLPEAQAPGSGSEAPAAARDDTQRPPEEDVEWATGTELPVIDWEPVVLPFMGVRVAVRFVPTREIARMQRLPDVVGMAALIEKLRTGKVPEGKSKRAIAEREADASRYADLKMAYMQHIAHIAAIRDRDEIIEQHCTECGYEHRRSVFTLSQVRLMQPSDLEAITDVALRAQVVAWLRPFSSARTREPTPRPSNSGESIPSTTSDSEASPSTSSSE